MRSLRRTLTLAILVAGLSAFAVACGGSASPTAPTPAPGAPGPGGPAADVTITIVGMNGNQSFSPNPAAVKVGQTVSWRNADSISHTATADGGAFNTGVLGPGATSTPVVISSAGSFSYHCAIHPSMVGSLTVQ